MAIITASAAGGNWSATTAWVGAVVPGSTDDVLLTSASGNITIDGTSGAPSLCRSLDAATGLYTGTLTHASAKQLNVGDPAGGGTGIFKLVAGMTYAANTAAILKFVSTTGANNITTAGKNMPPTTFDGVSGSWVMQDAWAVATGVGNIGITLTNGSLNSNGQTVTGSLSSSNSNTRVLTLGATTWNLNVFGVAGIWDIGTSTGMTLSAASSTIVIPQTTGSNAIFNGGGLTYGTVTSTASTVGIMTFTGANTYGTLTTSVGAGPTASFSFSANQTVTGTFTFNSNSLLNRVYLTSSVKGTARTITAATVSTNGGDLQDIVGAGAGSWNISGSTFGGGDCGGNSGIIFNTPKNCFMKTAVSVNWSAANWFTTSGGSTAIVPAYPLPQDTAMFDANSVTTTGKTITIDASSVRLPAMNWTGVLNTPALAFTTAASWFGSWTLVSSMTISGIGVETLEGRGSQTITTAGLTITPEIIVNSAVGTWAQQDTFSNNNVSNPAILITSGTFSAGAHNTTLTGVSAGFQVTGGTYSTNATLSLTGATNPRIIMSAGSGILDASAGSVTLGTGAPILTLTGGTLKAGTLTTLSVLTIAGTAVQIGTGGAAFATPITISAAGSLAPTTGNKITSVSATAITVSSSASGGSFSFS